MRPTSHAGMGPLGILFLLIILLIFAFLLDLGYIFGSQACIDKDPLDCALDMLTSDDEEEKPEEDKETVTATGVISGEFKGETRSVTVTLTFPLEGGTVTSSFSGECDGSIKGEYVRAGSGISGKAKGSCAFILPASGEFSGSVNRESKTVWVSGRGSAAGFSKEGSLTLSY